MPSNPRNPTSMTVIACVICTGTLAGSGWLFAHPEVSLSSAGMLLVGGLLSAFNTVVNYYFGSSYSAKVKDGQDGECPPAPPK